MATIDEMRDLRAQGLTVPEIAGRFGVSTSTVYNRLRSPGPPPRQHGHKPRDLLTQKVYDLMVNEQLTRLAAARRVIEATGEATLFRASKSKWKVTPRRLAEWSKP